MQYAPTDLVIIHTSDFHNRLHDDSARRLAELRDQHAEALLVDSGDAVWAGNLYYRPGGEPILRRMNELGYAAMAVGNREFHPWAKWFARKIADARFPLLCTNLAETERRGADVRNSEFGIRSSGFEIRDSNFGSSGRVPPAIRSHLVLEAGGRAVTFFGLTPPVVRSGTWGEGVSDFVVADPIERLRSAMRHEWPAVGEQLAAPAASAETGRSGAGGASSAPTEAHSSSLAPHPASLGPRSLLIIVLSHLGFNRDVKLAREVPGIDLILGGHTHMTREHREDRTWILHSGAFARAARIVRIAPDRDLETWMEEL